MTRLERFSHIAQVVGALGVIVSLLFVGSQIRQNTIALERTVAQSSLQLGHDWDDWLRDSQFAEVYNLALRDPAALTAAQSLQVGKYIGQGLNIWEFAYYSHANGVMATDAWEAWDRFFRSEIATRAWRSVWDASRDSYGERFRAHVSSVLQP